MEPKFISLPNGTVIDLTTIKLVEANDLGPHYKAVLCLRCAVSDQLFSTSVKFENFDEAKDLRDRIVSRLNEHSPIIAV